MERTRSLACPALALLAASCASARPSPPRTPVLAPPPAVAVAPPTTEPPPPPRPPEPPAPTAADQVRAALEDAAPVPPGEAVWLPMRVLEAVTTAVGEPPEPGAPAGGPDGRVVWSLVAAAAPGEVDLGPLRRACEDVRRAEPRASCAVDAVTLSGAERARLAVGWRRGPGEVAWDLALPLRALARLRTGMCLVSAERTLHTLELQAEVADMHALGTSLALLAAVPRMSDLILVDSQPVEAAAGGRALKVVLSWPTDRVDRAAADLGDDPWPARCGERSRVGAEAPARSAVTALLPVRGDRARGAVLNVAHHEWLVTEGDRVADATVAQATDRGVYVRRDGAAARARATLLRYAAPATTATSSAQPAQPSSAARPPAGAAPPIRLPLPPEPPAPSRPRAP